MHSKYKGLLSHHPIYSFSILNLDLNHIYHRLIQNRVSAQRFRQKRKSEFEALKDNLNSVLQENELLRN